MEAWVLFTKTSLLGALLLALFGVLAVWLEKEVSDLDMYPPRSQPASLEHSCNRERTRTPHGRLPISRS